MALSARVLSKGAPPEPWRRKAAMSSAIVPCGHAAISMSVLAISVVTASTSASEHSTIVRSPSSQTTASASVAASPLCRKYSATAVIAPVVVPFLHPVKGRIVLVGFALIVAVELNAQLRRVHRVVLSHVPALTIAVARDIDGGDGGGRNHSAPNSAASAPVPSKFFKPGIEKPPEY